MDCPAKPEPWVVVVEPPVSRRVDVERTWLATQDEWLKAFLAFNTSVLDQPLCRWCLR
jgi:hypothetical protein